MELRFDRVTKKYGKKLALDGFSFTLNEGVYALLGPNGAGKTTLMNCITDRIRQTGGTIFWDGEDTRKMGAKFRARLGYLPQSFGLYPGFTAKQMMGYFSNLKNVKNSAEETARLLELVNLTGAAGSKVGGFSGGMLRRLGIAIALLGNPDVLILDEPTAGLDPKERIRFRNLINEISVNRIVIFATHIVSDVEAIAKEAVLLRNGRIISSGNLQTLINSVNGRVWLSDQPSSEEALKNDFRISNINKIENGVCLRIVSDDKPFDNAVTTAPSLDDVYLYYFAETVEEENEQAD